MKITTYIVGAVGTLILCFSLFSLGEWLATKGLVIQPETATSLAASEECPRKDAGPAASDKAAPVPLDLIRFSPMTPAVYIELVEPGADPAKVKLVI